MDRRLESVHEFICDELVVTSCAVEGESSMLVCCELSSSLLSLWEHHFFFLCVSGEFFFFDSIVNLWFQNGDAPFDKGVGWHVKEEQKVLILEGHEDGEVLEEVHLFSAVEYGEESIEESNRSKLPKDWQKRVRVSLYEQLDVDQNDYSLENEDSI